MPLEICNAERVGILTGLASSGQRTLAQAEFLGYLHCAFYGIPIPQYVQPAVCYPAPPATPTTPEARPAIGRPLRSSAEGGLSE